MPILQINALGGQLSLDQGKTTIEYALQHALNAAGDGPIILMVHGKNYAPKSPINDPHQHLYSLKRKPRHSRVISWPRHLGFGRRKTKHEGLAIGFAWDGEHNLWSAYQNAKLAGGCLAQLIKNIHQIAPKREINVITHSLGARVFLSALYDLPAGIKIRSVLLAPAETREEADRAMQSPAAKTLQVINVTSRENDLFDFLLEWALRPFHLRSHALDHGLSTPSDRWLNLQLDDPVTLHRLRNLGFPIAPTTLRVCHWFGYLRPGTFPLYQALFRREEGLSFSELTQALPQQQSPRWSRIFARNLTAKHLPVSR
ncbi:MAG: alpha/beta hydrolase [Halocynthiibacter sp.]